MTRQSSARRTYEVSAFTLLHCLDRIARKASPHLSIVEEVLVRKESLTIFIPHPSALLTDHQPNGDGLTAFGFIDHLAKRGHRLHVAVQECAFERPLHDNITLYPLKCRMKAPILRRLEYMLRVRVLFARLRRQHSFDLIHQMNPVYSGLSLALIGTAVPLVLGTYVARWPDDPDSLRSLLPGVNSVLRRGREMICRLQQRRASTLLLTTPAAMNRISEGPGLGKKIALLQHGVDVSLFYPATGADHLPKSRQFYSSPIYGNERVSTFF